ncbi:MAG: type II CAAX endopeptidase family protein [Candidatus Magasanikiibacteriota bacterium]
MKNFIEVFIFFSLILIFSFFNFSTSNYLIPVVLVFVLIRIFWLFSKNKITVNADVLKNKKIYIGFFEYIFILILSVIVLFLFKNEIKNLPPWLVDAESVWFTLFHTGAQEIIFRLYLLNRLKSILNNRLIISIISGLSFGLVHFILPDALFIVILTSIIGILWSYVYLKKPNFILVWLSHFLLNIIIKFLAT